MKQPGVFFRDSHPAGETEYGTLYSRGGWPATRLGRWMAPSYHCGLVSVIIPTYNRADLLAEAMESVFAQSYRPIELLVVDDGSTDHTRETVEQFAAEHATDVYLIFRYLQQEHAGAQVARNRGLIESQGEYIQFLDSDDILHPWKLEKQARFLDTHPFCSFIYSYTGSMTEAGNTNRYYPRAGWFVQKVSPGTVLEGSLWLVHSGLYRREISRKLGPWDEGIRLFQDWEYNARLPMLGAQCCFLPEILSYARVHWRSRISRGRSMIDKLENGNQARWVMWNRARIVTDFNARIRCAIASVLTRSMPFYLRSGDEKNLNTLTQEFRSLNPCWLCGLRFDWLLLLTRYFGKRVTGCAYALVRRVRGRFFQIRVRVLWRLGFRYIRPPRRPLHAPKH